jgi:hypothetical protein
MNQFAGRIRREVLVALRDCSVAVKDYNPAASSSP